MDARRVDAEEDGIGNKSWLVAKIPQVRDLRFLRRAREARLISDVPDDAVIGGGPSDQFTVPKILGLRRAESAQDGRAAIIGTDFSDVRGPVTKGSNLPSAAITLVEILNGGVGRTLVLTRRVVLLKFPDG
jgi:hypothetical protein